MKFDIQQEVLANALDRVSMILGSESERDALYLFLYEGETLYVMASSNYHLAKTPVGADSVEAEEGESFTIHGRNTKVWVDNQLGGVISVSTGSGKANLICGKSKRSAKIGGGGDFPRMDEMFAQSEELSKISTKSFAEALAFSKTFICNDPSSPHIAMASTKDGALLAMDDKLAGFVWHDAFVPGLDLHFNTVPKVLSFLGNCTGDDVEIHKGEAKYFLRDTDSGSLLVFPTVAADFPNFGLGSRNSRQEPERWTMSKDILKKAVTALSAGASDEDDRLEFTMSGMSGDATLMLSMVSTVSEEENEQEVPDVIRQCFTRTEVWKDGEDKPERVSVELSDEPVTEMGPTTAAIRKSHLLRALGAFKDPDVTIYFPNEALYDRLDEEGGPFTGKTKHSNYFCISEGREGFTVLALLNLVA